MYSKEPNSIQIFKKIIFSAVYYICCGLFDERI
jgi:hypothetical protein